VQDDTTGVGVADPPITIVEGPSGITRLGVRIRHALVHAAAPSGVSGVGCLLLDGSGTLRAITSTSAGADAFSLAEELCHEGPSHDALSGYGIEVADVRTERRWPRLSILIDATPLHSVASVPVRCGDAIVGAIHACTTCEDGFTTEAFEALRGAADEVATLLSAALATTVTEVDPIVEGVRAALHHRELLDEAARYLAEGTTGDGTADGTVQLRRVSAVTGLSPVEVATRIVEEGRALDASELTAHAVERRAHRDELARLALTDPLTGLANRVLFFDRLEQALARQDRGGAPPSVIYLDIDRFKTINDSLGHAAGDQVLLAVADRLRSAIRLEDTACRLGGDEFAVLCEATGATGEAVRVGRRIARAIGAPLEVPASPAVGDEASATVSVHASVGVAIAEQGQRPTDVLRDADQAMYAAKARGGDRIQLYSTSLKGPTDRQAQLEVSLRRLLGGGTGQLPSSLGGVHLVYQPIVALGSGRIVAVEALVRWRHPQLGAVSAPELITAAELAGLIVPLGAVLLSEACRTTRLWALGEDDGGLDVCVNVSALQLADPSFPALVDLALERTGFPPERLCLELTESRLLEAAGSAQDALGRLAGSGVKLAIDDFGTGYSSLSYLSRLPVTRLKIDREFVTALDEPQGRTVIRAIISLAQTLGLETVGEGIETRSQADELLALDCQLAQGYLYSRPVPPDRLRPLLESGTLTGS
jgi:diguanylate cyclase (GGDEF)-like protein